jgi:hypothetical protein
MELQIIRQKIYEIRGQKVRESIAQLNGIYNAIENLLNENAEKKAEEQKWKERERIGFRS